MAAEQSTQTNPETWKAVVGYEGYYEVSDRGRVRSVDRSVLTVRGVRRYKGRLLALNENKGYPLIALSRGGNQTHFYVHRLVLEAFVGSCPEGMEACHNDGNPGNPQLENLRWDTRSENERDRVRHGTHHKTRRTHCPRGHSLEAPNLRSSVSERGHRNCKACHRAASYVRYHDLPDCDFQKISDSYYRVLMSPNT